MEFNLIQILQADGETIQGSSVQENGATSKVNCDIPGDQTDELYLLPGFQAAKIQSLMLKATVDVTLKTNDSADPDDIIEIPAGGVIAWDMSMPDTYQCPFTADVTDGIYVTNADAGHLWVYVLVDPT